MSGGLEGGEKDGRERAHSSSALRKRVCVNLGISGNWAISEEGRAHTKATEHLICTGNQK